MQLSFLSSINSAASSSLLLGASIIAAFIYAFVTSKSVKGAAKHSRRQQPSRISGLSNLGATCYMNALLQGLASSKHFVHWISELASNVVSLLDVNSSRLLLALNDVLSGLNDSSRCISSSNVIQALREHSWKFSNDEEQDLHELFVVFVTTWQEELQLLRVSASFAENFVLDHNPNGFYCKQQAMHLKAFFASIKKEIAIEKHLKTPCSGKLAINFKCCRRECQHKDVRFETFYSLTLHVINHTSGMQVALDSLLQQYFHEETVTDAVCSHCNIAGGLSKKLEFCQLPELLLLHIGRVDYSYAERSSKKSNYISFPNYLDVERYAHRNMNYLPSMVNSFGNRLGMAKKLPLKYETNHFLPIRRTKYLYELKAVSVHNGGMNSGHFFTYRRGIGEEHVNAWYKANDSIVSRVPYEEVASAQAYLLYYDRDYS